MSSETDPHRSAGSGADESQVRPPGTLRWVPLIMLGGALGTAARASLEAWLPPSPTGLPWVTLGINLLGSCMLGLLLGALSGAAPDRGLRRAVRLTLGTGILGGFTTYSTFMVETAERLRSGHAVLALAYLVGSVVACLGAAALGISMASRVRHAHQRRRSTT